MSRPNITGEVLGHVAYYFDEIRPLIPTFLILTVSAIFPIYTGAHASLSRPSSAAKPQKKGKTKNGSDHSRKQRMEGLTPIDAILYPIGTGFMLVGLYYLIQWLKDPEILNKILNAYLSLFAPISIAKLLSDGISLMNSFFFPSRFSKGDKVWQIDSVNREVHAVEDQPSGSDLGEDKVERSPLPGILSRIPLHPTVSAVLWNIRDLVTSPWLLVSAHAKGIGSTNFSFDASTMFSATLAFAAVIYYNYVKKTWWLTNIFGLSFSYNALQLLSPTTFATGSLILTSLFFYDIYFVFFTPMMVEVATKLDIPVKLLVPKPPGEGQDPTKMSFTLLGLGDIVVPGIMIGLALRFDLYMFYLKKQRRHAAISMTEKGSSGPEASVLVYDSSGLGKARYVDATGAWGERFWLSASARKNEGGVFAKPYFHASLVGYAIGMLVTETVMNIARHGQPALLYLVPSVLISLWGTALVRGELKNLWAYTEEEEPDDKKTKGTKEEEKTKLGQSESKPNGEDNDTKERTEDNSASETDSNKSELDEVKSKSSSEGSFEVLDGDSTPSKPTPKTSPTITGSTPPASVSLKSVKDKLEPSRRLLSLTISLPPLSKTDTAQAESSSTKPSHMQLSLSNVTKESTSKIREASSSNIQDEKGNDKDVEKFELVAGQGEDGPPRKRARRRD